MTQYRFGSARFDVPGGASMGMGLRGVTDYATRIFLDFFKQARPIVADGGGENANTEWLAANGYVDANGWPIALPPNATKFFTYWLTNDDGQTDATPYDGEAFVMTWEGEGAVTLLDLSGGVTVTSQTANRIEFTASLTPTVVRGVNIVPTNPANYPRNISIVPVQHQALYNSGEIFLPEYVGSHQGMRCLRFMDWLKTNNSALSTWAGRPVIGSAVWNTEGGNSIGVPLEVCVDLCNKVGADGWFCVPHQADDNYIAQMATLIRDRLSPGLKSYFEYSNETWNTIFNQFDYCLSEATSEWGVTGTARWRQWHGKRSTQMAQIIRPIWSSRWQDCSVVMGAQTDTPSQTELALTAPLWEADNPAGYVDPALWHDCIAVTGYYGSLLNLNPAGETTYKGWYDTSPATAHANLIQHLQDEIDNTLIPDLAANKALADTYGLSMVAYEANSHALFSALDGSGEEAYLAAAIATLTSQDAADKHEVMLDAWKAAGGQLLCWFLNFRSPDEFGVWGMADYPGDVTPVDTTVRAWFAANPRWWTEPGLFNAYAPGDRMTGDITFRAGERISSVDTWRAGPATVTVEGQAAASDDNSLMFAVGSAEFGVAA